MEQFRSGMDVEFEHGSHDPQTDVTGDDPMVTGKIALAHMKEFPDYYERLERMEAEAEREWAAKRPDERCRPRGGDTVGRRGVSLRSALDLVHGVIETGGDVGGVESRAVLRVETERDLILAVVYVHRRELLELIGRA